MRRTKPIPTLSAALTTLALAALPACSPTHSETAVWFPSARAGLATVDRSTHYAVTRAGGSDLLVFETDHHPGGRPHDRLTWLIEIKAGTPLQSALAVEDGGPASGWVLEEIEGKPGHAAPLRGTVSIAQRSAEALAAVVNVYAATDPPTAGEASGERLRLARRIEFDRRVPTTIGAKELETRSGVGSIDDRDDSDDSD